MAANNKRLRSRSAVIALFVLFFLPVVSAWVLNIYWRDLPLVGTTNYGNLVTPARQLDPSGLVEASGRRLAPDDFTGKWSLLYWARGQCLEVCRRGLYGLHQARLAMGKDMDRIQRLMLVPQSLAGEPSIQQRLGEDLGLRLLVASEVWLASISDFTATPLLIIDPQGYLMMTYPIDADPSGILKDLKRLLKISKVG